MEFERCLIGQHLQRIGGNSEFFRSANVAQLVAPEIGSRWRRPHGTMGLSG